MRRGEKGAERKWKQLSFSQLCIAYWLFLFNFCSYLLRRIFYRINYPRSNPQEMEPRNEQTHFHYLWKEVGVYGTSVTKVGGGSWIFKFAWRKLWMPSFKRKQYNKLRKQIKSRRRQNWREKLMYKKYLKKMKIPDNLRRLAASIPFLH